MALGKKVVKPSFNTPRGVFQFPRLGEADTKFKADGEFSVKVRFPKTAVADLIAKLEPIHAIAVASGKAEYAKLPVATRKKLEAKGGFSVNPLFNAVYDDQEQETGEIEMVFKMTASGEIKQGPKAGQRWNQKPAVFDAKMKPMDGSKVWGGTVGIVSFEVGVDFKTGTPGYFIPGTGAAGLKLGLKAVQVIDLVSGGQRSASSYGFAQEEGYESDTPAEETSTPNTEAGDPGPSDSDANSGEPAVDF